jgi:uncharacterized protein YecE (DUF72 family)
MKTETVAESRDRACRVIYNLGVPKRPKIEPIPNPTLFEMGEPEKVADLVTKLEVDRPYCEPGFFLGTSAFTAAGWPGTFYPSGMKPADYLTYYASIFKTVEIDSTYYATPSASTVTGWYEKTPPDFIFAAKIPQVITHEKILVDCEAEFDEFISRMGLLKDKLGPLLFQFPHFNKYEFNRPDEFLRRLRLFLRRTGDMFTLKFAVEIRNKQWLNSRLTDLLGEYGVALALTDHSYMLRPWEMKGDLNLITADFTYVRWLGDRHGIEAITKVWDKTVVDRGEDLTNWISLFRQFVGENLKVFAYANNHYAGNGPATVKLFWELWTVAPSSTRLGVHNETLFRAGTHRGLAASSRREHQGGRTGD